MLSVQEAETIIFGRVQKFDQVEFVGLKEARSRVLAQSMTSQLDFPHWDNSAMDGYAVRFEDVRSCPKTLEIIEEIPAGYQPKKAIQPGQAARIFTGAVMPEGADTIVIQENTKRQDNQIEILTAPSELGSFVRHQGAFYRAGEPLLVPGMVLGAPEIAVLAAAQCTRISVFRRLKVAVLSTGDELVSPDQPLQPGQIVDSNQYALQALVSQLGADVIDIGIVRDDPDELKSAIARALEVADVIISSGGVSVGDFDYVDRILSELGAEIQVSAIAVKPGKPLTFATFPNSTLYFGLPGNPVSALVTFWRFVQPAMRKLSGVKDWEPKFLSAIAAQEMRSDGKRETYVWGSIAISKGAFEFSLAGGRQNSGNLINLAGTNALGKIEIGQTAIAAGNPVSVLMLNL